ncbi:LOW QUALITY PROTEIN: hypothetical protein OSB04_004202 [Centaurea solstitialis]|uniref:ATP-dependent DNA helicase n=1 Tax=Centaurea solstitialis TaxID=347529 RepID=A0AA38WVW2_9ASTR|nr:LOW QUALITY PROTEIN: hypothetical protein OSB04_004202 [Centaurea solstitialis]
MEEAVLANKCEDSKVVSIREYYAYKLQIRSCDKSYLLHFGRLLQQYIVDNYIKLETQRLDFYRLQQQEIRQEFLQGVVDAMATGKTEGSAIGRRIVLPATFIGGPRNMRRKYVDAMTLVQKFGKPDIFLTITCNPNWQEIKEHLSVFHAKLEKLKHELFKNNIFGDVAAYTYVIEFQKRGLPHAHFLIILKSHCRMYTVEEYDKIVCAEIPDKKENIHLFNMVVKHMLHGPCGSLNPENTCMKNATCKNFYPKMKKQLRLTMHILYTEDEIMELKLKFDVLHLIIDGSFHIILICFVTLIDEIEQYQSGRWVSPPEGAWRIFRFPLGEIKPAVIHLPLHLENYQPLTFKKRDRLSNILNNPTQRKTMLTEFFTENQTNMFARSLKLTYVQFPDYFVWKADKKIWTRRQSGDSVGRIVLAHPSEGERYYLRILLSKVCSPKSFDDLRILMESKQPLLERQLYYVDICLTIIANSCEASLFNMPYALRRLFATLLVYTCSNNPSELWLSFENALLEDFFKLKKQTRTEANMHALQQVDTFLQSMGDIFMNLTFYPTMFREINIEKNIIVSDEDLQSIHRLNKNQKIAFQTIIDRINSKKGGGFFIDGPGGTGKTFLYKALLAKIRSVGDIALATATSGIAASLLLGGRTSHSRFKIPLNLAEGVACRISKQSSLANLIRSCKVIIWDEAPMANRIAVEALNGLLQDLMDSPSLLEARLLFLVEILDKPSRWSLKGQNLRLLLPV